MFLIVDDLLGDEDNGMITGNTGIIINISVTSARIFIAQHSRCFTSCYLIMILNHRHRKRVLGQRRNASLPLEQGDGKANSKNDIWTKLNRLDL